MNAVFSLELKLKDEYASESSVPISTHDQSQLVNSYLLDLISAYTTTLVLLKESSLDAGENKVKFVMEVSKPALWWPRGYGDQVRLHSAS